MTFDLTFYQPPDPLLWQGRQDSLPGERFFQNIHLITPNILPLARSKQAIFLGFASDAGVIRNQGRPGAILGPNALKTKLAKLPFHSQYRCFDLGNILCENDELETAQNQFSLLIDHCHQKNNLTIGLGGGHEIAWAHYQGIASHYTQLGIINFDAHFDLRPYNYSLPATSGTPFSQIAQHCHDRQQKFQYCCLGIQPLGNTNSLFERAHTLNVSYLTAEQINDTSLISQINFLEDFLKKQDHIHLSLCLDVFAACFAPGVSAPQSLGLNPWQVIPLLKYIVQSGKVVSLDIAELSPPLDEGEKTANLAANLVAELLSTM